MRSALVGVASEQEQERGCSRGRGKRPREQHGGAKGSNSGERGEPIFGQLDPPSCRRPATPAPSLPVACSQFHKRCTGFEVRPTAARPARSRQSHTASSGGGNCTAYPSRILQALRSATTGDEKSDSSMVSSIRTTRSSPPSPATCAPRSHSHETESGCIGTCPRRRIPPCTRALLPSSRAAQSVDPRTAARVPSVSSAPWLRLGKSSIGSADASPRISATPGSTPAPACPLNPAAPYSPKDDLLTRACDVPPTMPFPPPAGASPTLKGRSPGHGASPICTRSLPPATEPRSKTTALASCLCGQRTASTSRSVHSSH
eukprot:scaffold921_cov101-Isochrysis_galbana.AAC.12